MFHNYQSCLALWYNGFFGSLRHSCSKFISFCSFRKALWLTIRACAEDSNFNAKAKYFHMVLWILFLFAIYNSRIDFGISTSLMAPLQSSLMCFLYKGRVPKDVATSESIASSVHGKANDIAIQVLPTPITKVVVDTAGSNALKSYEPVESSLNHCILYTLMNTMNTSIPVAE